MKNYIFSLVIACLCWGSVSAQEPAMYVYRNDGQFNAFLMDRVDSMSYSNVGVDGLTYDIPVVQEIWTPDSLYRIPLSAIDSIGYQTPEPIMKQGLFIVDESNVASVIEVGPLRMVFSGSTPASQRPAKGQIIYSDLEDGLFTLGFSGRVVDISQQGGNYVYTCESAGPDEVYDRLIMVGRIDSDGNDVNSVRGTRRLGRKDLSVSRDFSVGLDEYLKLFGNATWVYDYNFYHNIGDPDPMMVYIKCSQNYVISFSSEIDSDIFLQKGCVPNKFHSGELEKEVYTPEARLFAAGPLAATFSMGAYASFNGKLTLSLEGLKYASTYVDEYTWRANRPFYVEHKQLEKSGSWVDALETLKLKLGLSGSFSAGLCCRVALAVWKADWLSLNLVGKVGPEFKGSFEVNTDLLKSESLATAMYKQFSENVKATASFRLGLDLKATYSKKDWTIASLSTSLFPKTASLLPKLTPPSMTEISKVAPDAYMCSEDPMAVSTQASNWVLFPGKVGLRVCDESGNILRDFYNPVPYTTGGQTTALSLKGMAPQTVKVYPQYKFLGILPMKADPAIIVIPKPIKISTNLLQMKEGESRYITTSGGWGLCRASSSNKEVAAVSIEQKANGSYEVAVNGLKPGSATVTVLDQRSGETLDCEVYVDAEKPGGLDVPVVIYPTSSYELSADGTTLVRWMGPETVLNMKGDPAFAKVTTIGYRAFGHGYTCNFETVVLSDHVTTLEHDSFHGTFELKNIVVPPSLKRIGNHAFDYRYEIENIYISDLAAWCSIEFEDVPQMDAYLWLNGNKINRLVIPEGVTKVNDQAFYRVKGISSVVLPSSLKEVGSSSFCNLNLVSLDIPGTLEKIGMGAFAYLYNLTNLKLNDGIKTIDISAFQSCTAIQSVVIPNSVTALGNSVFYECTSLSSVQLPNSISTIPYGAFRSTALKHITIPKNIKKIESSAFEDCSSLETITLNSGLEYLGTSVFSGCTSLVSVALPKTVYSIGGRAFQGCTCLQDVELPHDLKGIGNQPFYGCTNLKKVYAHMTTPPAAAADMFETYDATLWVPKGNGVIDLYRQTEPWKQFKNIIEAYYED